MRVIRYIAISMLVVGALAARAEVKTEEKTHVQFGGMLGRMVNLFGGKAAKEGVTETLAVKGNRKKTITDNTGQIIDLDEEKIYELDIKGKSYRVTTFEEMRRRMQEAQEKAQQEAAKMTEKEEPAPEQKGAEVEIDFNLQESGQRKTIRGYDCREVVMTITVREKGKTSEESGGMVLTSNMRLAPRIAALDEVADFERRYAEKLAGPFTFANLDQMATALAMYPYLKDAIGKFQAENVNLDGTAILTTMSFQSVLSREQMAQKAQAAEEEKEEPVDVTSVGGLLGGLGRKMARKKAEPQAGADPSRSTFMTTTQELLKVSADVADADLSIPANFKLKQ